MRVLNIAVPLAFLFVYIVGVPVYLLCGYGLTALGLAQKTAEVIAGMVALLAVLAISLIKARDKLRAAPESTAKTSNGHTLLAVGNFVGIGTVVVPLLIAQIPGYRDYGHLTWYGLIGLPVAILLWVVGWRLATTVAK